MNLMRKLGVRGGAELRLDYHIYILYRCRALSKKGMKGLKGYAAPRGYLLGLRQQEKTSLANGLISARVN